MPSIAEEDVVDMQLDTPSPPKSFSKGTSISHPLLNPIASSFVPSPTSILPPRLEDDPMDVQSFRSVVPAPPIVQTFPVTAHSFSGAIDRLSKAEVRLAEVEKDVNNFYQISDGLTQEIKTERERVGQLLWLYYRVDVAEKGQASLQNEVARISKICRNPQADWRFRQGVTTKVNRVARNLENHQFRELQRTQGLDKDVTRIKDDLHQLQAHQADSNVTAHKDISELRAAVNAEYGPRVSRIESTLQLMLMQIKAWTTVQAPSTRHPARGTLDAFPSETENLLSSLLTPLRAGLCV